MQGELSISLSLMMAFALTMIRLLAVFVFLPLPGAQAGPSAARVVLAIACTFALSSRWPAVDGTAGVGQLMIWAAGEAVLGLAAGLAVGLIAEAFILAAQVLSLPAGYAYASTFDPNTHADSGILLIFAQLMAGLLFFTTGLDRQVIRAFAESLTAWPPGTFAVHPRMAEEIIRLGATVFHLALRLALPVVALLLLVDIALGVLGRLNSHIQVITLAFPVKLLLSLLILAITLTVVPKLYESQSKRAMQTVYGIVMVPGR